MKINSLFKDTRDHFHSLFSDRYSIYLLIILIIGTFLRFYGIGSEDLWLDEVRTVWFGSKGYDLITAIKRISTDLQGPLYFIVIHFWLYFVEISETTIRIPSAVFGILSIFYIYRVSAYLFNRKTGIYSAIILALSPVNIYYSQEARTYTLSTLLTLLSYYYFLMVLRNKSKYYVTLYILSTSFLVYSHYYFLLIIFSQTVYFIIHNYGYLSRKQIKEWTNIQSIILICLVPAIYLFLKYQINAQGISRGANVTYLTIFKILKFLSGSSFNFLLFSILSLLGLCSYSLITKKRINFNSEKNYNTIVISLNRKNLLLITWLFIPILTAILVGIFYKTTFFSRYFIICTPALFILVALGIDNIRYSSFKFISLILIICISLVSVIKNYQTANKPEWKKLVEIVENNYKENDLVIYYPGYLVKPFNYYSKTGYFPDKLVYNPENKIIDELLLWAHPSDISIKTKKVLNSKKHNNIWLINTSTDNKYRRTIKIISNNHQKKYTRQMSDKAKIFLSLFSTKQGSK